MPFLQPLTNNYFGAMPASMFTGGLSLNAYPVSSSEAADVKPGDVCVMTSIATVKAGTTAVGTAALASVVGIAQNLVTAGTGTTLMVSSGSKALIYDDPDLLFVMSNTTSGAIAAINMAKAYMIAGTGPIGTYTGAAQGRSVMAISGITASSAGNIKIVALHPIEGNYFTSNATGTAQKFICMWNAGHIFGYSTSLLTT